MQILTCLPVVFSWLLAAAHFYRAGSPALAAACLFLPTLMCVRHREIPRLLTILLLLAGLEWLRTLYELTGRYHQAGIPVTRLTTILLAVSLFTFLSPLVFRTATMQRRYCREDATAR